MSRRKRPAVAPTIALRNFDRGPESLRAVDEQVDALGRLRDVIAIFGQWNVDRLRASARIDSLSAIEWRPWWDMPSHYFCDAQRLARLLCPLHISPRTIRWFEEAPKLSSSCNGARKP